MKNIILSKTYENYPAINLYTDTTIRNVPNECRILRRSEYMLSDKSRLLEPFSQLNLEVRDIADEIVVNFLTIDFSLDQCLFRVVHQHFPMSNDNMLVNSSGNIIIANENSKSGVLTFTNFSGENLFLLVFNELSYGKKTFFMTFVRIVYPNGTYFLPIKEDMLKQILSEYYSLDETSYDLLVSLRKKS